MIVVYDIECLVNFFSITFLDIKTNEHKAYIIYKDTNQLNDIIDYLKDVKWLIGFNNLAYDYPLLHHLLCHKDEYILLNGNELTTLIYKKSQSIIESQFSSIRPSEVKIKQIDLFKIWHFDNAAKRTSLKWLMYMCDWYNIEDMPFNHYDSINSNEDVESILNYNINDVLFTKYFYDITLGKTNNKLYKDKNKIELRSIIQAEFGIDCINYNDVKIGDEVNKLTYSKLANIDKYDLKKVTKNSKIKVSDCIEPYIQFNRPYLQAFLKKFKEKEFDSNEVASEEGFNLKIDYLSITLAYGGLHSNDTPRSFESNDEFELVDKDCASMYPRSILTRELYPSHLGIEWLQGYKWIHDKRIEMKPQAKNDKKAALISESFKLALNGGGFGKLNEINSWQYDPLQAFRVTINNQLCLLMLVEWFIDAGITVISCNTDGVLCYLHKDKKDIYEELSTKWEQLVNHTLEATYYTKFIQTSVNDYIAIEKGTNKAKYKGDFEIDKELHKNKSNTIIPIAMKEYFINNKSIEDTITNHTNIFDFCIGMRSKGDSYFTSKDNNNITTKLSKTIRYYISNTGNILHKNYNDGRQQFLNVHPQRGRSWYATMFNVYIEKDIKDYNINYNYYIWKARKEIAKIETNNLSLF